MVQQLSFLHILQMREANMASMYGNFGDLFPGYSSFWYGMMHDEDRHATIVTQLLSRSDKKELTYAIDMVQLMDFYSFHKSLQFLMSASTPAYNLFTCEEAVWLTIFIEEATIQQLRVRLEDTENKSVQTVLNILMHETEGHFAGARDFAEEYGLDEMYDDWGIGDLEKAIKMRIEQQGLDLAEVSNSRVLTEEQKDAQKEFDTAAEAAA